MAETREMLRVANLHAWYGESHVLHGVDFTVNRGEVVTLLGRNGAGRTSTLKSVLGMVGRRSGSIVVDGVETVGMPSMNCARLTIGRGSYRSWKERISAGPSTPPRLDDQVISPSR